MSRKSLAWAGGGAIAAAVAALGTGVVVERRVVRARRDGAEEADRYGSLRAAPQRVECNDGAVLHAEVDEAPDADPALPTVVLVHGFALNMDCWHFQREALRGHCRLVLFDQRSHGRSPRAEANETIDQLGQDLAAVVDQLTEGPLVLVGHSMGGMSVLAYAEQLPEVFARRVVGVGLVSTTAGGLRPHRTLSRLIPDGVGMLVAPRVVSALSKAPELVDSARRNGSNIGYLVAQRFAFGTKVSPALVEFLDEMLAGTPYDVLASFFPTFTGLDKFTVLEAFARVPTTILCGTRDRITSVGHSRKMASRLPSARLVEVEDAGHMVLLERPEPINAALLDLVERCRA